MRDKARAGARAQLGAGPAWVASCWVAPMKLGPVEDPQGQCSSRARNSAFGKFPLGNAQRGRASILERLNPG